MNNDLFTGIDTRDRRAAGIGTGQMGTAQYWSEEFYAREAASVWQRSWLLVGRAADLVNVGDYCVFTLEVAHASILVVRSSDGRLRAFHNACRHRGARLLDAPYGQCKALRCAFHGWTYGLDGKLTGAPYRELFSTVDWDAVMLQSVPIDTWGGFVFVHLGPNPACSLREYLQPLPDALQAYLANEDWRWHMGYKNVFDANWKIFIDGQIEGHHASFLHSRTIRANFAPADIPSVVYPESPAVLSKIEVSRPASGAAGAPRQTGVTTIANRYSKSAMWTEKNSGTATRLECHPGAVNSSGSDRWVFDLYVLFPNVTFLFEEDQFIVQRCWPLGPHRTAWELDHYFVGPPRDFGDSFNRELGVMQEWDTVSEDAHAALGIHANFRAGVVPVTPLSDLEIGIELFHRKILAMAGTGTESAPGAERNRETPP